MTYISLLPDNDSRKNRIHRKVFLIAAVVVFLTLISLNTTTRSSAVGLLSNKKQEYVKLFDILSQLLMTEVDRTISDWVNSVLLPNDAIRIKIDRTNNSINSDVDAVDYRMEGVNYIMSSRSSRLQRLPMLAHQVAKSSSNNTGYRFPSNPAIVPHPSNPNSNEYLLVIQLGSASNFREENAYVHYHEVSRLDLSRE